MTEDLKAIPPAAAPTLGGRAVELVARVFSIPLVILTLCLGFWAAVIWLGGIVLLGVVMFVFAGLGIAAARHAPTVDRLLLPKDLSDSPAAFSLGEQGLEGRDDDHSGRKDSFGPKL